MNCKICGRVTPPTAKLCPDCRAARKRAFDATVTQPLLAAASVGRAARSSTRMPKPSAPPPAAVSASASQPPSERAAGAKWPLVVAALAILLLAGGYLTQRLVVIKKTDGAAQRATEDEPREQMPSPAKLTEREAPRAAPTGLPLSTSVSGVSDPSSAVTPVFQPAVPSLRMDLPKRPNARARPTPPIAPVIVPEPAPAPEPVAVAPPPPVVREEPRPDPWQPLNDALARCPRNDILGHAACVQRALSLYCNGHWGQVPQCASIPYFDHGQ